MTLDSAHLVQTKAPGLGLENPLQTTLQLLWALSSLSPLSVSFSLEARPLHPGSWQWTGQTLGGLRAK